MFAVRNLAPVGRRKCGPEVTERQLNKMFTRHSAGFSYVASMTHILRARLTLCAALLAIALPPAAHAGLPAQAERVASVAGAWQLSITGDHVVQAGLVLEQDGVKVTGALTIMGKEAPVTGDFVDGKLTLTSSAQVTDPHGEQTNLNIKATLQEDGTLDGKYVTQRGSMALIGERFKKRSL